MAETMQTQATTTTKKDKTYNPSSTLNNLDPGLDVNSGRTDLGKYGIDYSQEEQDRIASIFQQAATGAYGQAQNSYAQDMANQQATLSDTIRRSQAEAVATGASRGMQAANELSSILGLQQAAAEGATTLQGDYAAALANAQQQAAELQTQRAQVGAEIFNADAAANAQKYAANVDFAANDFMRIMAEAARLSELGDTATADMLLKNAASANGIITAEDINKAITDRNSTLGSQATQNYINEQIAAKEAELGRPLTDSEKQAIQKEAGKEVLGPAKWSAGQGNYGTVEASFDVKMHGPGSQNALHHTKLDFGDLAGGSNDSGIVNVAGNKYYVKVSGGVVSDTAITSKLNTLSDNATNNGTFVYYNDKAYVMAGGKWHEIIGDGSGASYDTKSYNALMKVLKGE